MDRHDPKSVVGEVIEAHGGAANWNRLEALEAEISAFGALFTAKWRPALRRVRVRVATREPHFAFFDHPDTGQTSEIIADDEVRILGRDGRVLNRRAQPRLAFRGLRRKFYWDSLDFVYFGGYATWNYLVTPFLFLREGFRFETLEPLPDMPASWPRLQVTFPSDIPTHSRAQVFYFDEQRLLRRLDYVAEVVGGWARAAHLCEGYREFGGFKFPTVRRVRPLPFGHRPLPGPTLIGLDIHEVRPVRSAEAESAGAKESM